LNQKQFIKTQGFKDNSNSASAHQWKSKEEKKGLVAVVAPSGSAGGRQMSLSSMRVADITNG